MSFDSWTWLALEDLVDSDRGISYGIVQPGNFLEHGGVPVLKVNNLTENKFDLEDVARVSTNIEEKYKRTRLKGDEILVSLVGSLGHIFKTTPAQIGWNVVRAIGVLPIRNEINRDWVYWCLKSPYIQTKFANDATVTVQATLNLKELRRIKIPFPDEATQRRIADILSALDDKIELNRQTNATLEAMAQAIFQEWFVNNEDSNHWRIAPLSEIIEINPIRNLRKNEIAPYLDMANVPTQGHRAMEWRDRPFGSGMKFINGDTLLARITPCLENGKTAFVDFLANEQTGWGSTEFIVFSPKPPLPPQYGYYLARTEELRNHAIQNMIGTSGRQRTPLSSFDNFMISVPPDNLANQFGEFVEATMAQIRANDDQSRILAQIRDTILPKLMRGEIEV